MFPSPRWWIPPPRWIFSGWTTGIRGSFRGPWLQRLMSNVNFDDYESRMWFDKALRETGLYQQLEERGIEDGDTVSLDGYEFEYQY